MSQNISMNLLSPERSTPFPHTDFKSGFSQNAAPVEPVQAECTVGRRSPGRRCLQRSTSVQRPSNGQPLRPYPRSRDNERSVFKVRRQLVQLSGAVTSSLDIRSRLLDDCCCQVYLVERQTFYCPAAADRSVLRARGRFQEILTRPSPSDLHPY